jgi:sugar transferase (PEP-CTERM/EpsH1 system associated)
MARRDSSLFGVEACSRLESQPLRLMQLAYSLKRGGSERLAVDLCLGLDPFRIRSSLCALDYGGPLADELRSAAIPFHVLGRRPGLDWSAMPKLYRLFRENRVDVVQTHHFVTLFYGVAGARLTGADLVHVEHEYFSLQRPKIKRCLRLLAPLCAAIVAVGHQVQEFLVREVGLPPSKVRVIRNGVDTERYSPQTRVPRTALGLRSEDRLIGHVGRLEAEKDQQALLRACRIVFAACPDVRLVIVGDGTKRRDLEQTAASLGIAERVDFLGVRDDVNDLLPHMDVFVLSSVNEGLPLALLEAMACARPVVATAVGEIPRVIRDGVTGVTAPPGDPARLAASIRAVLDRPAWAAEMGRSARQQVEETFSLALTIRQYQDVYDSLRRAHHPPRPSAENARN